MVQSVFVQQLLAGMHWLLAPHAFWPTGHWHCEPGLAHVSPMMVQSLLVQHAPMGMHWLAAKHAFLLGGQLRTHWPFWHTWSDPQLFPHLPQLPLSFCRLTQVGPLGPPSAAPPSAPGSGEHSTSGGMQLTEHEPIEHTWPDGHALPHDPQFIGSFWLTHLPLHAL
jgi:hypothetical protein